MADIREGRWDCQYCGTVGVLGRHKACPVCSKSRPEGTKFYLPSDAQVVTDAAQLGFAKMGPDWVCEFCSTSNGAKEGVCSSCGAARGTAPAQKVQSFAQGEAPRSGDMDLADKPRPKKPTPAIPFWQSRPVQIMGAAVVLILLCCCGFSLFNTFFTRDVSVTVASYHWERTSAVEAYQTVTEEGWDVPAGGRTLSQSEEIRSYDQVLVGYETKSRQVSEQVQTGSRDYVCGSRDLGNGYFEDITCSDPIYETQYRTETYEDPIYNAVPVYDTYYTYEIDKWVVVRTEESAGDHNEPFWPPLNLQNDEREGARTELYRIVFETGDGQQYPMELPYDQWIGFERGREYSLTLNGFGDPQGVK